jgi:hypothetical protein
MVEQMRVTKSSAGKTEHRHMGPFLDAISPEKSPKDTPLLENMHSFSPSMSFHAATQLWILFYV